LFWPYFGIFLDFSIYRAKSQEKPQEDISRGIAYEKYGQIYGYAASILSPNFHK
jgi:hypothetical protein